MKCKTTAKAIRENYGDRILSISYCAAQALLHYESPFAYSAGVYGWNCDYYDIDGVCIATGYRPIGRSVDYRELTSFEDSAAKMREDWRDDTSIQKTRELLRVFIASELARK